MEKMPIDFYDVPVFIISYNRLEVLAKCVSRYEEDGYSNLIIIDNASTDKDLLKYLSESSHQVVFLDKNYGHRVLWECHRFDDIISSQYYVLTDPDILPVDECPSDYVEKFYGLLQEHPNKTKAGFALKLDDLPEEYPYKYDVIRWESFFWEHRIPGEFPLYDASIDTTFALYRPGFIREETFFDAVRTGSPYVARHLGWYVIPEKMSASERAYFTPDNKISSSANADTMRQLGADVAGKLANEKGVDFFQIMKAISTKKYMSEHLGLAVLGKSFIYLLLKKIYYAVHGRE